MTVPRAAVPLVAAVLPAYVTGRAVGTCIGHVHNSRRRRTRGRAS